MIAIRRDDMIIFATQGNRAGGNRFLADVKMQKSAHVNAGLIMLERRLFKAPDAKHLAQQFDFIRRGQLAVDGSLGEIIFGQSFHVECNERSANNKICQLLATAKFEEMKMQVNHTKSAQSQQNQIHFYFLFHSQNLPLIDKR
jgi:hypothetical protein